MQVHSLVHDLEFHHDEVVEMAKSQSLSPDGTINLLHELLELANGGKFHPREMSNISGLECGFWRNHGTHVWAHHDELIAMGDEIILRNPGALSSGSTQGSGTASQLEVRLATTPDLDKTPLAHVQDCSPDLGKTSKPTSPHELEVYLEILGAQDLPSVRKLGVQSPYCKWKITDPTGQELASGRTHKHNRGGRSADWSGHASVIRTGPTIKTLAGCKFCAVVKTATVISSIR
jgi:hypothetical protein